MVDRLPGADDFRQRVDVARIVVQPALEGGLLRLGEAALAKLDRPARRRHVAMIETVHYVTPSSSLRLSRDRKSVTQGKGVTVRVDFGGRSINNRNNSKYSITSNNKDK